MVFGQAGVRALAAGIEGIDHVTGLRKSAMGRFKVVMATSVAMEKDDRLAGTFRSIEKAHAVHFDGVCVAFVSCCITGCQSKDYQKGKKMVDFHMSNFYKVKK
jgi:hypothetical protein